MAIKFGVIGSGAWGTKVINTIRRLGYDCLVCNRHGEFEGKPVFDDYDNLIDAANVVFIAADPATNYEMVKESLIRKRTTIVEKPVCFNAFEVAALRDISLKNKSSLIVDYIYLFNEGLLSIDEPEVRTMDIVLCNNGPTREYSALWDYGSHAVAVVLHFVPRVLIDLRAEFVNGRYAIGLTFTGGVTVSIMVSAEEHKREALFWVNDSLYADDRKHDPLAVLISRAAHCHLLREYWTNADLAVEVTDVLERLHKLLKIRPPCESESTSPL